MNFYISDLHLGHQNIIAYDGRPFNSLMEMHNTLIKNWNYAVSDKDTVYVLGDFAWKSSIGAAVAKQLNGKKILILGNHDNRLSTDSLRYFESVKPYAEIEDLGHRIVLSHYPIAHWNRQLYGSILLYGHVHNSRDWEFFNKYIADYSAFCCKPIHAYNVGCMLPYMDYTPRTLNAILS